MERCVTILISNIWPCATIKEKLKDIMLSVMSGSLEQRCSLVRIHLVDISMSHYEPLTDILVLLHAGQSQGAFTVHSHDPRVSSELEKQAHNLKMVVDRGFHETCQAQIVFDIDVEDPLLVLPFLDSPMVEKHFDCLCVTLSASDVQSVTAISVLKVNVYVLLEEKLNDIELIFSCCNQKRVPCEVIW